MDLVAIINIEEYLVVMHIILLIKISWLSGQLKSSAIVANSNSTLLEMSCFQVLLNIEKFKKCILSWWFRCKHHSLAVPS